MRRAMFIGCALSGNAAKTIVNGLLRVPVKQKTGIKRLS